jgi:molybdopterin-dependent oxidoreductase alpha subunit
MKDSNPKAVKPIAPEEPENLTVDEPKKTAAGLVSITKSMKRVWREMGLARGSKSLRALNQKGGIDCQSCAWADPEEKRTLAEFCENGAKAMADEGTTKRVTPDFFTRYNVAELLEKTDFWLNAQGRLTEPMFLAEGATHYQPVSWEKAFDVIAEELNLLASPDEACFYTSGRTSNEAAFLYQLFVRQFGTNNLPDCSNMCHESTTVALTEATGLGKANIRLEDFEKTDLVIVIGQNPGTNAPRMMSSLQDAKRAGARMMAINPLPEAGLMNFVNPNPQHYSNPLMYPIALLGNVATPLADLHLPVRIGGDMAVLKGMMKVALERERLNPKTVFDHDFINEKTEGFAEFIAALDKISWSDIVEQSGLSREKINEAAEMYITAERIISCWAMGVTQHKHAVATIQDIANLHFLRGQIGKSGAGLCPVRGHSNVQGDRTMGIAEKMPEWFLSALDKEFNFTSPRKHGFDTVESIKAMHNGQVKVFLAMGGNFLSATPDTEYTAEALRNCNLTAQVITKLNRTALVHGKKSLILPCLGRSEKDFQNGVEQFVSTESTLLNVQMSKGVLEPESKYLRSEVWIVSQMAQAVLGTRTTVDWEKMTDDYDHIRDAISRVARGFDNYNQKIRVPGGFYLPNPPHQREFPTDSGRAKFTAHDLPLLKVKEGQLMLTTIRSHDQFNTTIYSSDDRYRGISGERRVIFMNEQDIAERNLQPGQTVDITSHFDDRKRHAHNFIIVKYPIPKGCAAAYFPETNVLVPIESVAEKSNTPTSKLIFITVANHHKE